MFRDIGKDAEEGTNTKGIVIWNREMMLATLGGGKADMTAGLSGNLVTEFAEGLCEVVPERSRGSLIRR